MVKPPQPDGKKPKVNRRGAVAKAARAVAAGLAVAAGVAAAAPLDIRLQPDDPLQATHPHLAGQAAPAALLQYQQDWIADDAQLKIAEKGRRVGLTWGEAADDVLIAAADAGSNVFYISATQDMAREYIEACAMWTRAFDYAAAEVAEGIYDDGDDAGVDPARRFIKTYEIVYPKSGHRIVALSSRPTNLRGKQGVIVIDEAAFAPDLAGLLKAALAMLLHGDKVRIISTHDGADNPFANLIQEVRAGKRGKSATVHRITFQQAVQDGLYQRICLRRNRPWTQEAQDEWVKQAYQFYADDAAEELDAVPSQSSGAYLSLALIEQRSVPVSPVNGPVIIRGAWKDDFAYLPEDVRHAAILGWLTEELRPHMQQLLHKDRRHCFGEDFARNRNLTVFDVLEEDGAATWRVKLQIELFNCPFSCQEQILYYLVDGLPRFRGGAMDAGGNGAALAEKAAQRYGTQMIEQVKLNDGFYLLHMPKLKAALEDGTLTDLPRDAQTSDDLRAIKVINGIPKLQRGDSNKSAAAKAAAAEGGEKVKRHGDAAIAIFLALYATKREVGEIGYTPAPPKGDRWGDEDARRDRDDDGWGLGRKAGI